MMLRSWLLSILVSALAISSLHLWRHRHKPQPVPVADTEAEEIVALAPIPRLGPERPSAQRPVRKPAATGMATIRGRVLGLEGPIEDTEEELTLVVSDEEDEFEATIEPDGSFAVELAPGTYHLHAQLEKMTATLEAVTVAAEEDKEVVLQLTAGVSIKGTLRPPNDEKDDGDDSRVEEINLHFEIRLSGESEWSESEGTTIKDNQFTVTGLDAGKRYDLFLTAEGFRPVELKGVPAPSDGLVVDLVRLAQLRGGFGIARGEECPISEVLITADDDKGQAQLVLMDPFCRFQTDRLPPASRVRVQVSEEDWHFDVLVDIPPQGNPPFLCLRSLCREPAPEELSTLEISLVDSPDKSFVALVALASRGVRASSAAGDFARVSDIRSGQTAMVSAFSRSCRSVDQELVLQPGINRVTMTCQKQ
jgi:hypothetical protein